MRKSCYWMVKESLLAQGRAGRLFRIDVANMGYRDGISFNAFFNPMKKRNWVKDKLLYTTCPEIEHEIMTKGFKEYWPKVARDVANLSELFDLIHYDRKKKKLISLVSWMFSHKKPLPKDPLMLMSDSGSDEPFRY